MRGPARPRVSYLLVGVVAVVEVAWSLLASAVGHVWEQPSFILIAELAVGWSLVGSGLAAWLRRPGQPAGIRLVVAGFLWSVGTFQRADSVLVGDLGFAFQGWHDVVLALLVLSFPARVPSRASERVAIAALVAVYAVNTGARLLYRVGPGFGFVLPDTDTVFAVLGTADVARGITLLLVAGVALRRLRAAAGPHRALGAPVFAAGAVWSVASSVWYLYYPLSLLGIIPTVDDAIVIPLAWLLNVVRIAVPVAMYAGIARLRRERRAVADAMVELAEAATPERLEDALASALGDRSLRVYPWDPAVGAYLGHGGTPAALDDPTTPEGSPGVTYLSLAGEPLAAVAHDPALGEDPGLVAAIGAAVRLTVHNERLERQVHDQLEDVRASRARIVAAGDAERQRIERDLHDGAQQRLVALAMRLRRASGSTERHDPDLAGELREMEAETVDILNEIRELAVGIHSAVLTEVGLAGALRSLADRAPFPVDVTVEVSPRPPASVESAAWFTVSEALANTAKHARATRARVEARRASDRLRITVEDNGSGGADPAGGSGLRGLEDRVAAVGGTLVIASSSAGTTITADIPCASS